MKAKVKSLISVRRDDSGMVYTDILSFNSSGNYNLQKALETEILNLGSNLTIQFPDLQEKQFEIEIEIKTPDED